MNTYHLLFSIEKLLSIANAVVIQMSFNTWKSETLILQVEQNVLSSRLKEKPLHKQTLNRHIVHATHIYLTQSQINYFFLLICSLSQFFFHDFSFSFSFLYSWYARGFMQSESCLFRWFISNRWECLLAKALVEHRSRCLYAYAVKHFQIWKTSGYFKYKNKYEIITLTRI